MAKVIVYLPVFAEYSVAVDTDEVATIEGEPDWDEVLDKAYNELPSGLCIQCSGGAYTYSKASLELGSEPEARYIMDEDGNTVWGDPDAKLGW